MRADRSHACLNEADTIEVCVSKALRAIEAAGIDAEVVVADNGSTDGSQALAEKLGARVVDVKAKGYGSALMGGIAAARGRFVIMGDADDSYDFLEIPKFVQELRRGFEVVQGCRLPWGGGTVLPGAMPFLHRWWGNPMFSIMARRMFGVPIHDIYCGMRGFTKRGYLSLDQRCTGMEFATEMIIKASRFGLKIGEVPITLHPDGRKAHAPHLKTFRDGWRTLRFFLMCSPRWLFLRPGDGVIRPRPGRILSCLARRRDWPRNARPPHVARRELGALDRSTSDLFAIFVKMFALNEGLLRPDARVERFFDFFTLEKGLVLGGASVVVGGALLLFAVLKWQQVSFGNLDYGETMRFVIPAVTLIALGIQTILGSFMISIMSIRRT